MEFKKPKTELNPSLLLLSPSRKKHFRACKSPLKQGSAAESSIVKQEHGENHFAKDLIKNFPCVHEHFDIVKKVGEGAFSKVYLGRFRKQPHPMIAIKHLIPTSSPKRIENELKCLKIVGGKNNVLGIECAMRKEDHVIFILPYMPHQRFSSYFRAMKNDTIQCYMKSLFIALKHVHSYNIIHRDVKPSNFIHCKERNAYTLIDFGLAMAVPGTKDSFLKDYNKRESNSVLKPLSSNVERTKRKHDRCNHTFDKLCTVCLRRPRQSAPRAGTPGFRSPEVLMKYPLQTTAVDMWSAGVILLSILSGRYPFFTAKDDLEALAQIKTLFRTSDIKHMAQKIGKTFECSFGEDTVDSLETVCKRLANRICPLHDDDNKTNETANINSPVKILKPPSTSIGQTLSSNDVKDIEMKRLCICINDKAYDLLEKLLTLDPFERMSAEEALKHPFITSSSLKTCE